MCLLYLLLFVLVVLGCPQQQSEQAQPGSAETHADKGGKGHDAVNQGV